MLFRSPWDRNSIESQSEKTFLDSNFKSWGTREVNWYTLMSYNALMSMASAIKESKSSPPNSDDKLITIRKEINSAINSGKLTVDAALGQIHFSTSGYVDTGNFICTMEVRPKVNSQPDCRSSNSISIKGTKINY